MLTDIAAIELDFHEGLLDTIFRPGFFFILISHSRGLESGSVADTPARGKLFPQMLVLQLPDLRRHRLHVYHHRFLDFLQIGLVSLFSTKFLIKFLIKFLCFLMLLRLHLNRHPNRGRAAVLLVGWLDLLENGAVLLDMQLPGLLVLLAQP